MSQQRRSARGRILPLLSLAAAGILAAACGDDTSPIAQKVDACTLLKSEDLKRVIGVAFEPAKKGRTAGGGENQGYMSTCTFSTPEKGIDDVSLSELREALRSAVFVNVMVWSWPTNGKGSDNYLASIAKVKEMPTKDVPGVGEKALWNGGLHVKQGHVNLVIDMSRHKAVETEADDIEKESALAKIALGQLPK